jgi:hypothetical protein
MVSGLAPGPELVHATACAINGDHRHRRVSRRIDANLSCRGIRLDGRVLARLPPLDGARDGDLSQVLQVTPATL